MFAGQPLQTYSFVVFIYSFWYFLRLSVIFLIWKQTAIQTTVQIGIKYLDKREVLSYIFPSAIRASGLTKLGVTILALLYYCFLRFVFEKNMQGIREKKTEGMLLFKLILCGPPDPLKLEMFTEVIFENPCFPILFYLYCKMQKRIRKKHHLRCLTGFWISF